MSLIAFTLPDDPAAVPAWLERRLLSPDVGRLVAELAAAFPRPAPSARQLLGVWYDRAVADGLAAIPAETLRQLLTHPPALLEFQEAVLTDGGPHWDAVARDATEWGPVEDRGRAALDTQVITPRPSVGREQLYRRWAVGSTAVAACLAVAVGVVAFRGTGDRGRPPAEWGWARPGGIPVTAATPADYLTGVADSAEEWFQTRPADAPALARRIAELRAGCSALILAQHPLPLADREWLTGKCQEWARKLDAHLAAVEAGTEPDRVRDQVDETVTRLVRALRDRAGRPG